MTTQTLKEAGQLEEGYYWLHGGRANEQRTWLNWLPVSEWEIVYIEGQQIIRLIAGGSESISAYLLSYPDASISERLTPPTDNRALSAGGGSAAEVAADGDLDEEG